MKYRLTEDWLGDYKKGHVFEEEQKHLVDPQTGMDMLISPITLSLLLKTGILEEVKEEEWPKKGDRYWFINFYEYFSVDSDEWDGFQSEQRKLKEGNVFRSKTEAKEASEQIKTLLLSLKK